MGITLHITAAIPADIERTEMNQLSRAITACIIAASASALLVAVAPMASASTVVAEDPPPTVIAEDTTPQAPSPTDAQMVRIDANLVDALSVTGHRGRQVTASAPAHRTRSVRVPANRPAVLTRLDPGVRYTISIGSTAIGSAIPVGQVSPATGLVVETT
ncbi:MAG: hypothetical protein PSX37_04405, partial [bacterium]|nr:hypothetical protein [bacterium]